MTWSTVRRVTGRLMRAVVCMCIVMLPAAGSAASYDAILGSGDVIELRAGVSGRVTLGGLVAGGHFVEGELLVGIESGLYQARLQAAGSRAEFLRGEFEEAQKAFERNEILYEEGSLSQVEFDHAELALKRARSEYSEARANLAAARKNSELAGLVAPFDGTTLSVDVGPGEFVNAATQAPLIARIAKRGSFVARFQVPIADRQNVSIGVEGNIIIGSTTLTGRVGALRMLEKDESPAWLAEFHFSGDQGDLFPGMPARVELP